MTKLSLEDIEFIKILAISDSTVLQSGMNDATKARLNDRIVPLLRDYYLENTMGLNTGLNLEFKKAGISEDDGKAAIACARRLGIDIS